MLSGKKKSMKMILFTLLGVAIFILFSALFPKLAINLTGSINARVMYISGGEYKKKNLVIFDKTSDILPNGKASLAKRVFCIGGDNLTIEPIKEFSLLYSIVTCNKTKRKIRISSYKGLKPFIYKGKIPTTKVFLLGDDDGSFDSRYYGFIASDKLTKVRKIF